MLVAGTGAVAGRIVDGELRERRDGWGWLLGDEGSGFWLGREAIRATLTTLQQPTEPAGPLTEAVIGLAGTRDPVAIVQLCYANPPVWLSTFAELVTRHAEDPVAAAIATRAAQHLLDTLLDLDLDPVLPVVLAGSVATRPGPVRESLRARLDERLGNPVLTAESGLVGALWLAAGTLDRPRRGRAHPTRPFVEPDQRHGGMKNFGTLDKRRGRAPFFAVAGALAHQTATEEGDCGPRARPIHLDPDRHRRSRRRVRRQRLAAGGDVRAVPSPIPASVDAELGRLLQDPPARWRLSNGAEPGTGRQRARPASPPRPAATPAAAPRRHVGVRHRAGSREADLAPPAPAPSTGRAQARRRRPSGRRAAERPRPWSDQTSNEKLAPGRPPATAAACRPTRRTRRTGPSVHNEEPVRTTLRGAPARTAKNMDASLTHPDRHQRPLAAGQAADRPARRDQQPPAPGRGGKVSFTHLIGFAMVQALKTHPGHEQRLRASSTASRPWSSRHTSTSAWPSTCPGPTAPASCSSPASRAARPSTSPSSGPRTRRSSRRRAPATLTVTDFAGTTITLTNPGTIGTNHSVPRLMQGQGAIIGVGSMDYPPEFQGSDPDKLVADERLQGDDADLDLRPPGDPGRAVRSVPGPAARAAAR